MSSATAISVHELRRLWKPPKERLAAIQSDHATTVRVHRACSWLGLTETLDAESQADFVLVHQWIAFNALYGHWDEGLREPVASYHAGAASERESREGSAQSAVSSCQVDARQDYRPTQRSRFRAVTVARRMTPLNPPAPETP